MPNVEIRDVPIEVHKALVRRAEKAGQSLDRYLMDQLAAMVTTPSVDEFVERFAGRPGGRVPLQSSVEAIHVERQITHPQ